MKQITIILMVVLTAVACKQNPKDTKPTKMQQVMAAHDSLMPKMNTIIKLVGELNEKVDTTETGTKYKAAQKDLQGAHQAMMDWMQDFGTKFDHEEILKGKELTEEKKALLEEEEVEVKALKKQINGSIANAEKLLDE